MAAAPNGVRGEIVAQIGGSRFLLRPTFTALAKLETSTGEGVMAIAARFTMRRYGVLDVARVLQAGIAGASDDQAAVPAVEALGALVVAEGLIAAADPAMAFLEAALDPGGPVGNAAAPGKANP